MLTQELDNAIGSSYILGEEIALGRAPATVLSEDIFRSDTARALLASYELSPTARFADTTLDSLYSRLRESLDRRTSVPVPEFSETVSGMLLDIVRDSVRFDERLWELIGIDVTREVAIVEQMNTIRSFFNVRFTEVLSLGVDEYYDSQQRVFRGPQVRRSVITAMDVIAGIRDNWCTVFPFCRPDGRL